MMRHTEKWALVPARVRGYVTLHLWFPLPALIVQGVVGVWAGVRWMVYSGKFIRRRRSWKRGSERRG